MVYMTNVTVLGCRESMSVNCYLTGCDFDIPWQDACSLALPLSQKQGDEQP